MLTLAGEPNAAARAHALVDFETGIAKVSWTNVQNRDSEKTYNKMTVAKLSGLAPGFDFAGYFKAQGAKINDVVVAQPSAVTGIARLIRAAPLGVLRDQLLVRFARHLRGRAADGFRQGEFRLSTVRPCRARPSSRCAGSARSIIPLGA